LLLTLGVWTALCGLGEPCPTVVAAESSPAPTSTAKEPPATGTSGSEKHSMQSVLDWAKRTTARIESEVPDYSAILLKLESIDGELDLPIRFEAYDWPTEPEAEPPLAEQYTYTKLKLNNGFSDTDFDVRNPRYGYSEGRQQ
jgi:hypothetical protein